MPLVFVHGVANRPAPEHQAEIAQRDALFRAISFRGAPVAIFNPDWGSHGAKFTSRWLPSHNDDQAFSANLHSVLTNGTKDIGLGRIAQTDVVQAVDLALMGVLEAAIVDAAKGNGELVAASKERIALAATAAQYLAQAIQEGKAKGSFELGVQNDLEFANALSSEFALLRRDEPQTMGAGDLLSAAIASLGETIGAGVSDLVLRAKRQSLSEGLALFLGDIFVYLRGREVEGPTGTKAKIFAPIISDLIKAADVHRPNEEPFVVVGHSLGGVLLFDILTDANCMAQIQKEAPGFRIDYLLTVGSQPGFFADLGLFRSKPTNPDGRLAPPPSVNHWSNVYDFVDVFSYLCEPFFAGVDDLAYDTKIDLVRAHSAYFKRPSFYKRLELRLNALAKK